MKYNFSFSFFLLGTLISYMMVSQGSRHRDIKATNGNESSYQKLQENVRDSIQQKLTLIGN